MQTDNLRRFINSTTKTVISPKYHLDKSFLEVSNRIHNWISEMPE